MKRKDNFVFKKINNNFSSMNHITCVYIFYISNLIVL